MTNTNKQNLNQNLKSGKTQIPLIVENLFAKTTPKNIMRDLAENFFTRERAATHQQALMDARNLQSEVLHRQYAQLLGRRHSDINEVLTEYPTEKRTDKPVVSQEIDGRTVINTEYFKQMKEYEDHNNKYRTREKLESEIKGLHLVRPDLGRLHREINDKIAHHQREIDKLS